MYERILNYDRHIITHMLVIFFLIILSESKVFMPLQTWRSRLMKKTVTRVCAWSWKGNKCIIEQILGDANMNAKCSICCQTKKKDVARAFYVNLVWSRAKHLFNFNLVYDMHFYNSLKKWSRFFAKLLLESCDHGDHENSDEKNCLTFFDELVSSFGLDSGTEWRHRETLDLISYQSETLQLSVHTVI